MMNLNLCRLCYEETASVNIFESEEVPTPLVKIKVCCGSAVNVQQYDGLPSAICRGCLLELDDCYRFVQVCKAADKKIRSLKSETINVSSLEGDDNDVEDLSQGAEANTKSSELEEPVRAGDGRGRREYIEKHIGQVLPRMRPLISTNQELSKLVCTTCGKEFKQWPSLALHLAKHTNAQIFQCFFCETIFPQCHKLNFHMKRMHFEKDNKPYVCEKCGKRFEFKYQMKIHFEAHTSKKSYACTICSKVFKSLIIMKNHKKKHTNKKSYICCICGKDFWTASNLQTHNIVHKTDKPFECHICHSRYKHKGNLSAHLKVHLEPDQFVCHHCGRPYTHRFDLVRHIQSKHSC